MLNKADITFMISNIAKEVNIDPNLCIAIASKETELNPELTRFEPKWSYFLTPVFFATKNKISVETEKVLQAISWGPLQVMGTVCRELGYSDQLPLLMNPELSIRYSCQKIKNLSRTYMNEKDIISAYNGGAPKKNEKGEYKNQKYVDDVVKRLALIRENT